MTFTGNQIAEALREAYHQARLHRVPASVIVENGRLKVVTRASKADTVLISDINPPIGSIDVHHASREVASAFKEVEPAFRRFMDIVDKDGTGKPRSPAFKAEMLEAFIHSYEIEQEVDIRFRKQDIPEPRRSWWTNLFGIMAA